MIIDTSPYQLNLAKVGLTCIFLCIICALVCMQLGLWKCYKCTNRQNKHYIYVLNNNSHSTPPNYIDHMESYSLLNMDSLMCVCTSADTVMHIW